MNVTLGEITPQQIQDFYQIIFDEEFTPNTVIHYHAVIRKALQNAVKKEIIGNNAADKIDKTKKNIYQAQYYTADEIMTLFNAVSDDLLEICSILWTAQKRGSRFEMGCYQFPKQDHFNQTQGH